MLYTRRQELFLRATQNHLSSHSRGSAPGPARVSDEENGIELALLGAPPGRDVSWTADGGRGGGGSKGGNSAWGVRLSGKERAWAEGWALSSWHMQSPSLVTGKKRRQSCSDPTRRSPGGYAAARPMLPTKMGDWQVSFRKQLWKRSMAICLKMTHDLGVCLL